MVSKWLMGFWGLLDFLLLAAGGLSIGVSLLWRKPDVLMNFTIHDDFLTAGMVVGIALCATFVVSLGAVVQKTHVTGGFVILNYVLLIDCILVVTVGTMVWFFSLRQRDNYHIRWLALSSEDRISIQDEFKCCGYFNGTDAPAFGGFCSSPEFANALPKNDTTNFCVGAVTKFTDYTLENTFTTIYGFMSVVLSLLICSCCVIKKRQEQVRFERIDAKRGGRGFV